MGKGGEEREEADGGRRIGRKEKKVKLGTGKLNWHSTRLLGPAGSWPPLVRSSPSVLRDKPIRFDLIWRVGVYECYRPGGDPYGELLSGLRVSLLTEFPSTSSDVCYAAHAFPCNLTIAFPSGTTVNSSQPGRSEFCARGEKSESVWISTRSDYIDIYPRIEN